MSVRWFRGKDPLGRRRPKKRRVTPVSPVTPSPKYQTRKVRPRMPGVIPPVVNVPFTYSADCECGMCKSAGGLGSGDRTMPVDRSMEALERVFQTATTNGYVVDDVKWLRHGTEYDCPASQDGATPICAVLERNWNTGAGPKSLADIRAQMAAGSAPYHWASEGIYAISHPGCNCGISIRFVDSTTGMKQSRADIYATAADIPGFEMDSPAEGIGIDSPEDSDFDFTSPFFGGSETEKMPGIVQVPVPGMAPKAEEVVNTTGGTNG